MSKTKEIFSRIKDFFGDLFELPSTEISPEREEEIIDKVARAVSRFDMELPAMFMGNLFVPISTIVSQTVLTPSALFFELIGIDGYEVAAFFRKKDNLKRLISRLEELQLAKEQADRQRKKGKTSED